MCHALLNDPVFFRLLTRIDAEYAEETRQGRSPSLSDACSAASSALRDSRPRLIPPDRNPVLLPADLQASADLRYHSPLTIPVVVSGCRTPSRVSGERRLAIGRRARNPPLQERGARRIAREWHGRNRRHGSRSQRWFVRRCSLGR